MKKEETKTKRRGGEAGGRDFSEVMPSYSYISKSFIQRRSKERQLNMLSKGQQNFHTSDLSHMLCSLRSCLNSKKSWIEMSMFFWGSNNNRIPNRVEKRINCRSKTFHLLTITMSSKTFFFLACVLHMLFRWSNGVGV